MSEKKIKYIVQSIIIALVFLTNCSKKIEKPRYVSEDIVQVQYFGDDDKNRGGFISEARSIASDDQKYLYVNDWRQQSILQYSLSGDLIRKIGSEGRGPGELSPIVHIDTFGDMIFTMDIRNFRISRFSQSGELVNSFPITHSYLGEFCVSRDVIIVGGKVNPFQSSRLDEESRFYMYDWDGNLVKSFGSFLNTEDFSDKMPATMSSANIEIKNGLLYVVYRFFPLYQVFSLDDGSLVHEQWIKEVPLLNEPERNKHATFNELTSTNTEIQGVIANMDFGEKTVYLQKYDYGEETIAIAEFVFEGLEIIHQKNYMISKSLSEIPVNHPIDFVFNQKRNSFFFLESGIDGVQRISEYELVDSLSR